MNLYMLSQDYNRDYNTYDSMIVAAETEEQARNTLPPYRDCWEECMGCWVSRPELVTVDLIGTASQNVSSGVILASFNAG